MKMTLEDLLNMEVEKTLSTGKKVKITPNFLVSVQSKRDDGTIIIIHPEDHDGDTLDFIVNGNHLEPF